MECQARCQRRRLKCGGLAHGFYKLGSGLPTKLLVKAREYSESETQTQLVTLTVLSCHIPTADIINRKTGGI
jgi:hypothetical protein